MKNYLHAVYLLLFSLIFSLPAQAKTTLAEQIQQYTKQEDSYKNTAKFSKHDLTAIEKLRLNF